jgi:tRNA(Ser,Leu) C12 N-acetylase TAN1
MTDWNVVVSVQQEGYREARRLLARWGEVGKTDYYNVLVLKVADLPAFIEELAACVREEPGLMNALGRVVPVTVTFTFQDPEDFESKAKGAALQWLPELAGKSFHVRMHRRGLKGRLSSQEEEKFLAEALTEALAGRGSSASISFDDPDAILAVETVGNRAGLSLWNRTALRELSFLRLD